MPPSSAEIGRYILHLNHALAMEAALIEHLEQRAAAVPKPSIRERLLQHRDQTRQHAETVRATIKAAHGEATTTKAIVQPAIAPRLVGRVMTALESEKEDRLLMETLADYAVEQYEAALYSGLILIARNLGYPQSASEFEAIRRQELDMAEFIANAQPGAIAAAFPPSARAA